MQTYSIIHVLTILTPTFFVLALGYVAGRYRLFDGEKSKGLTELVLDFVLPAALFIGVVTFPHQELLQALTLFQAFFLVFLPVYVIVFIVTRFIFHQTIGASSLAALLVTFPSTSFFGTSVVGGLFGNSSDVSISISVIVATGVFVPLSICLLEISSQTIVSDRDKPQNFRHKSRNITNIKKEEIASVIVQSVVNTIKKTSSMGSPLGIRVPEVAISSLNLIGSATSGVGIFVAGLTLAAYRIKLNYIIIFNVLLKSLVQPTLMIGIILILGIKGIFANEAIILCVLPSAVLPVLLAIRYQIYESEASSTLILTSVTIIVTVPLYVWLIGA
jgi:malonate transporter and related proteins